MSYSRINDKNHLISATFCLLTCNYGKGLEHNGQERKKLVCKSSENEKLLVTVLLWRWQRLSRTLQVMVKVTLSLQSPFLTIRNVKLLSIKNIQADGRWNLAILGAPGCVPVTQIS